MHRQKDVPSAVRVYTVCDESRYLIVKNVPALGCGDELLKLFSSHGEVEDIQPMDAEECDQFTDVYWIKFRLIVNARFAKRKLDESVFYGNRLQVAYAPQFESVGDVKDKLEGRRKEVLARVNPGRSSKASSSAHGLSTKKSEFRPSVSMMKDLDCGPQPIPQRQRNSATFASWDTGRLPNENSQTATKTLANPSFNKDYFPLESMNQTLRLVRQKLDQIQSSAEPTPKPIKPVNRRRI